MMTSNHASSVAENHGSSASDEGASSSKKDDSKDSESSHGNSGRKLFHKFLELCKEFDKTKDMEIIAAKLTKSFDDISSDYRKSSAFHSLLKNKIVIVEKNRSYKIYTHVKEISDEMKANRKKSSKKDKKDSSKLVPKTLPTTNAATNGPQSKKVNLVPCQQSDNNEETLNGVSSTATTSSQRAFASTFHSEASTSKVCNTSAACSKQVDENLPESSGEPKGNGRVEDEETAVVSAKTKRFIDRLEIAIAKLHRKIKQLEKKEIDFEDSDFDESAYVLKSRYEERLCTLHRKLCKFKKESVSSGRKLQAIRFSGTKYQDINRAVEKFFNKKREFPNFPDIVKVVTVANKENDLNFSSEHIHEIARSAFKELGDQLKRRRQFELHSSLTGYLSESEITEMDPAKNDVELERKLQENKKLYQKKMDEVINTFAEKQSEINESAIIEADAEMIDKGVTSPSVSSHDESDMEDNDEEIEEEVEEVLNEKEEGENGVEVGKDGSEGDDAECETESEAEVKVGNEETLDGNDEAQDKVLFKARSKEKNKEEVNSHSDDKEGDPPSISVANVEEIKGTSTEILEQEKDVEMAIDDVESVEGEDRKSGRRQSSSECITVLSSEESKDTDDVPPSIPTEEVASVKNSCLNEEIKSDPKLRDASNNETLNPVKLKAVEESDSVVDPERSKELAQQSEAESSKESSRKKDEESLTTEKSNQKMVEDPPTSEKVNLNQNLEKDSCTSEKLKKEVEKDPKKSLNDIEDSNLKESCHTEKKTVERKVDAQDRRSCLVEEDSFVSMQVRLEQVSTGLKVSEPLLSDSPIDVLTNPVIKMIEEDIFVASSSGSIYLSPEKKRTGVYISPGSKVSKQLSHESNSTSGTSRKTANHRNSCQKLVIYNPSSTERPETEEEEKANSSALTPSLITGKNSVVVVSDCGSTFVVPKKENKSVPDKHFIELEKSLKKAFVSLEKCDDLVAKYERRRKKRLKSAELVSLDDSPSGSESDNESSDSRTLSYRRRKRRSSSSDSDFDPSKCLSSSSSSRKKKKRRNSSQNSCAQLFPIAKRPVLSDMDDIIVVDEVPARKKGSEEIVVEVDTSSLLGILNPGPSKSNVPYNFQNYPRQKGNVSITPIQRPPPPRPISNLVPKLSSRTFPMRIQMSGQRSRGFNRPSPPMRMPSSLALNAALRTPSSNIRQNLSRFRQINPQRYQQVISQTKNLPRGGLLRQQSSFQSNARQFNGANGKVVQQNQSVSTYQVQQTAPKQTTVSLLNNRQNVHVVTKTVTQTVRTVVQQQRISHQTVSAAPNRNASSSRVNSPQRALMRPAPAVKSTIKPLPPHADVITID